MTRPSRPKAVRCQGLFFGEIIWFIVPSNHVRRGDVSRWREMGMIRVPGTFTPDKPRKNTKRNKP